jgi:sigma-54 dependent transcriptional regulator, acetoin dehydrogenase operon transcriptional activator AcoR
MRAADQCQRVPAPALEPVAADGCVERSWQRSRQTLASGRAADLVDLRPSDLDERIEQCQSLIAAARPDLDALGRTVGRSSGVVLLSDSRGVILHATGCADFLQRAQKLALQPGVSWAESDRGTNAIGTALVEGRPVRIHGREHFLDCNHALSCHAAPIRSPQGALIGVLDISNDAARWHPHALALARAHARQIANRIVERAAPGRVCLALHDDEASLEGVERALVLIEDGRFVGANEAAAEFLQTSWVRLLGRPADDWFDDWRRVGAEPRILRTSDGRALHARQAAAAVAARVVALPAHPVPQPQAAAPPAVRKPALPPLAPDVEARLDRAVRAFDADLSVMLLGETGAGKEVCAQHLHARSRWRAGPVVAVNCAALPESLIEAELFGYAAGAFTGARRGGMTGRMREAEGGVLFLDEIGDMPLSVQARLLRALQERAVQPLGSDRLVPVSFGLVCATNRDLHRMVRDGLFRADLYYRLHDYTLTLPPLRERPDLRDFLRAEFTRMCMASPAPVLDDDALDVLASHAWPGNYRELQATLRVLALFTPAGGVVCAADLPEDILHAISISRRSALPLSQRTPPGPRQVPLQRESLIQALQLAGGNISRAAAQLGIHRSTFYRRLAQEGLSLPAAATTEPSQG